jgi:hypothetical protein
MDVKLKQEAFLRHIQVTFAQGGNQTFQGVFDCADLGDLAEAVSEGIRAFQRANPKLTKHGPLGTLAIELTEVGGIA